MAAARAATAPTREAQVAAAEDVVRNAPRNPDSWNLLAIKLRALAGDERRGRTADQISGEKWDKLNDIYAPSPLSSLPFPCCLCSHLLSACILSILPPSLLPLPALSHPPSTPLNFLSLRHSVPPSLYPSVTPSLYHSITPSESIPRAVVGLMHVAGGQEGYEDKLVALFINKTTEIDRYK